MYKLNRQRPAKAASGRTWELEMIVGLVALVWLVGAIQFVHHMI
ncbi:MAG: hypothetical protein P8Y58_18000 [Novosphingobium sp.]